MTSLRRLLVAGLCMTPVIVLCAQEKKESPAPRGQVRDAVRDAARDARNADEPAQPGQPGRGLAIQGQPGQLDKYFVSCLRGANQGEITLSKLAEQRASNPEVKAFAQEMIKDHTDMLAKLDRLNQEGARPAGAAASRTETRTETRRTETTPPDADKSPRPDRNRDAAVPPGARTDVRVDTTRGDVAVQAGGNLADQLEQVNHEIHERCLASAQKELSEKEGKEFDQCFMFMQVGAHQKMVDTLTVLKTRTTGELQQTIEGGLQTAQRHLEHAKQLAKKTDDNKSSATSVDRPATERPGADANKTRRNKSE